MRMREGTLETIIVILIISANVGKIAPTMHCLLAFNYVTAFVSSVLCLDDFRI